MLLFIIRLNDNDHLRCDLVAVFRLITLNVVNLFYSLITQMQDMDNVKSSMCWLTTLKQLKKS